MLGSLAGAFKMPPHFDAKRKDNYYESHTPLTSERLYPFLYLLKLLFGQGLLLRWQSAALHDSQVQKPVIQADLIPVGEDPQQVYHVQHTPSEDG
mmetsp:Transcript_45840/g.81924  ORF Transcript_45840/g.81924 Transcript_45840/m.81924 type:complete len:95 (-) Transcript_45840:2445-2729(-)